MTDHDDPTPAPPPRREPRAQARRIDASAPGAGPVCPPLSDEVIADLHAGALDADTTARLWPTVLADDESARLLDALDSVRGRLAALRGTADAGDDAAGERARAVGGEPMPELVAARLRHSLLAASSRDASGDNRADDATRADSPSFDALRSHGAGVDTSALGEGSTAPMRPVRGGPSRRRPSRRRLVASAAAVAAIGVGVAAPVIWAADGFNGGDTAVPVAAPDAAAPESSAARGAGAPGSGTEVRHHRPGAVDRPIAGPGGPLDAAKILSFRGSDGRGPFADPARLDACLTANGLPARAPLLGSGPVHVDGHEGTLLLVPGPHAPMLTALIVTPECGQGSAGLIDRTDVGG